MLTVAELVLAMRNDALAREAGELALLLMDERKRDGFVVAWLLRNALGADPETLSELLRRSLLERPAPARETRLEPVDDRDAPELVTDDS